MRYTVLFAAILIALADTNALANDSTNVTPNTGLTPADPPPRSYVLSTGAYLTRCRWAASGGSGSNRGETNCKIKTVSNSLCAPGYNYSASVSTNRGNTGSGTVYLDQPVLTENGSGQYNMAFWDGANYLNAKVATSGSDDQSIIVSYVIYCTKGPTTEVYDTQYSLSTGLPP